VATDGLLNLIPFETLTKNGDRYLIEDHQFVYLSSGRDVLKDKPDLSGHDAFVLADPDFMADPAALPVLAESESSPQLAFRGDMTATECLVSMFSPLPMTRQEGISVTGLLDGTGQYNVTYLESDQAREDALKNLTNPPDILHMATHGYFCQNVKETKLSNPLLRSGLILAGANRTIGEMNDSDVGSEDGILTALEVSGLNLIGTDLVVLSACQTGIGDVRSGEGVFGLRRAFQHAGAKSMVMSMFTVPDESTSYFMERFYSNWLSGQTKSSALRNTSLSIIKELREEKGFAHPLFWGGFILAGDPN
jgi:CHAT domain-containing protein